MTRSLIAFGLVAVLLSTGCVPVTEPVGDIDKAEPNKELLGEWLYESTGATWIVDRPDVKGNPKGLMRIRIVEKEKKLEDVAENDTFWFFTATVGKHTYANMMFKKSSTKNPNFAKEGEFAEWAKGDDRGYWVGLLTFKDDTLVLDGGNEKAFEQLMTAEKITKVDQFYTTKPGWLAECLEKKGPATIFTGGDMKFARIKKK